MAAQGHGQLVARNAAAVVFHRDQAHAAGQQAHVICVAPASRRCPPARAPRGGALDHLAGSDLADQLVGQVADRRRTGVPGRGSFR
jgi:hypothetical protein